MARTPDWSQRYGFGPSSAMNQLRDLGSDIPFSRPWFSHLKRRKKGGEEVTPVFQQSIAAKQNTQM